MKCGWWWIWIANCCGNTKLSYHPHSVHHSYPSAHVSAAHTYSHVTVHPLAGQALHDICQHLHVQFRFVFAGPWLTRGSVVNAIGMNRGSGSITRRAFASVWSCKILVGLSLLSLSLLLFRGNNKVPSYFEASHNMTLRQFFHHLTYELFLLMPI